MTGNTQLPDEQIEQQLHSEQIAWLITVRKDGRPHSIPVSFAWDGTTILVLSQPGTQKIRNLHHNQHVHLLLGDSKTGSNLVTIEGTVELSSVNASALIAEEPVIARIYREKYADLLTSLGSTLETLAKDFSEPIRITPTRFLKHSP